MKNFLAIINLVFVSLFAFANTTLDPLEMECEETCAAEPDVIVYEFPNFTGRSVTAARYRYITSLPFPSNNISIRIPAGYQAVVETDCLPGHEFPSYYSYYSSRSSVSLPGGFCRLEVEKTALLTVTYKGIVTNVHNGDCTRFYGKLGISSRSGYYYNRESAFTPSKYNLGNQSTEGRFAGSFTLLDWRRDNVRPRIYNYLPNTQFGFFLIDSATPYSCYKPVVNIPSPTNDLPRVEIYAQEGKRTEINTSVNLGSAHKGCDFCTDFTWESKMATALNKPSYVQYDAGDFAKRNIVLGPFPTSDGRHTYSLHLEVSRR